MTHVQAGPLWTENVVELWEYSVAKMNTDEKLRFPNVLPDLQMCLAWF